MKLEILPISNRYKDKLDNLINSLNDRLDIEFLAMSRQIDISNNNILSFEDSISALKKEKNLLINSLHRHQ